MTGLSDLTAHYERSPIERKHTLPHLRRSPPPATARTPPSLLALAAFALACGDDPATPPQEPPPPEDPPCSRTSEAGYVRTDSRFTEGPVFWPAEAVEGCIPVAFDPVGSKDLPAAAARDALWRAADSWAAAAEGCGAPLCLRDGGDVPRDEGLGLREGGPNHNLVTFTVDAATWDALQSPTVIAVTTTTINARTGALVDADVNLNDAHFLFADDEVGAPPDALDLETVLRHELGHLLGFDHGADPGSVMFPTEASGGERRGLSGDDVAGICEAFGCY